MLNMIFFKEKEVKILSSEKKHVFLRNILLLIPS